MGGSAHAGEPAPRLAERLIAAYTQRYQEAARWKLATWVGSASLYVAGLVTGMVSDGAPVLGLVASGYLLCSRLVLRPEMTRAHREGVVIQEQYDLDLYALSWNPGLAGRPVPLPDVEDLAGRFKGDSTDLSAWYANGGKAPHGARVLLRQLENATWGRWDHRRFAVAATGALVASVAATVLVGLSQDVGLDTYVSTLAAPALPWLLDLADLAALHWRASARRGEIEADLAERWAQLPAGPGDPIGAEVLRGYQDRIFAVRRASGRVPTWFYRLYRDRNHEAFQAAANRMLAEKGWSGDG
jgi:hypothetical protein